MAGGREVGARNIRILSKEEHEERSARAGISWLETGTRGRKKERQNGNGANLAVTALFSGQFGRHQYCKNNKNRVLESAIDLHADLSVGKTVNATPLQRTWSDVSNTWQTPGLREPATDLRISNSDKLKRTLRTRFYIEAGDRRTAHR